MKLDFDSILYIVITIVILVIGALGSRRKKRFQEAQAASAQGSDKDTSGTDQTGSEEETYKRPAQTADPLSRLEQFLTGQMPEAYSMEGESLETLEDEEEKILEDIQKSRLEKEEESEEKSQELSVEEPYRIPDEIQAGAIIPGEEGLEYDRKTRKTLPDLFANTDEIKKAVIYNEILNRKYE